MGVKKTSLQHGKRHLFEDIWRLVVLEQRACSVRILDCSVRRHDKQAQRGKIVLTLVLGCRGRGGLLRTRLLAGVGPGTGTKRGRRDGAAEDLCARRHHDHHNHDGRLHLYSGASRFLVRASGSTGPYPRLSAHVPARPVLIPLPSAITMAIVAVSAFVIAIAIVVPSSSVVVVISPSLRVPLRDLPY